MTHRQSFTERNRAATERLRALIARLSDSDMQRTVFGEWTVAITLAHLGFWDQRVLRVLEDTEREGKLVASEIDMVVNDLLIPFFAAIPPREAARLALESAETVDERLDSFPPILLAEVRARYEGWAVRAIHRDLHMDQIDAAMLP